jgi:hypothetical protein
MSNRLSNICAGPAPVPWRALVSKECDAGQGTSQLCLPFIAQLSWSIRIIGHFPTVSCLAGKTEWATN